VTRRALIFVALLSSACHRAAPPPPAASRPPDYAAGKAALEAGRLDEAEIIFRALIAPDSHVDELTRDNSLLVLASVRKERGDLHGAIAYAERVAEHRPDDEDALSVLVELTHEGGDVPAEIAARERFVAAKPDALDQRLALAGALAQQKDFDRAKDVYVGYEAARTRLVIALGKSRDASVRRAAASALGAAHDAGTARALVLSMTDRDASVREAAVRSVAEVGLDLDPEVRPALKKLATLETDPGVKAALDDALKAPAAK
jgi:tetratricopeptide (TPR) repeat protein